jgi:branched-chain amino acid transport system ATP-binding protein
MNAPDHSDPEVVLEVRDLAVHIGGLVALAGISFQVPPGAIVSLIGPNGAGKTTAFNVVTGFMKPTDGQVFFRGLNLARLSPERIAALGMVRTFQRTSLFTACSVFENVLTALHLRGRTGLVGALLRLPAVRREEVSLQAEAREILDFTGLAGRAAETAGNLPYGEQRRLGLAVALAAKPTLLLLDEPAAGLNPSETESFKQLIRRVRERGTTVLLVEHDMQMVMSISDEVLVLNQGRMIAAGSPAQMQRDPEVIRAYLGTKRVAA